MFHQKPSVCNYRGYRVNLWTTHSTLRDPIELKGRAMFDDSYPFLRPLAKRHGSGNDAMPCGQIGTRLMYQCLLDLVSWVLQQNNSVSNQHRIHDTRLAG